MTERATVDRATSAGAGLEPLRALFPVLAQTIHGAPLAYLDNAATTQTPLPVQDAMRRFERHDRANIHRGVHTLSQRATDAYELARNTLKRFVGAGAGHELVFTSGTTEALNLVAHGLSTPGAAPAAIQPGDEIIVSGLEHHANLCPWQQAARRCGARASHPAARCTGPAACPGPGAPADTAHAGVCRHRLRQRHRRAAALRGLAGAGRRSRGLHRARCRTGGRHAVPDLSALDCDFMAFSGHKMYGPMGTGALVGRRSALERLEPLRYGGDMVAWVSATEASFAELPMRLEGGTPNVAGAVGLAAAAAFIDQTGRARIDAQVHALRAHAAAGLARLPGVTVLSARTGASAIVSFVAEGVHPHDIGTLLDEQGIAVRTGHHCAQPLLRPPGPGADHPGLVRALQHALPTSNDCWRGVAHALKVLR
jgi:cysteine desulfurase/selenocysteine lyase